MLDGEKTWISNGGIAEVYTVFARTDEVPGTRGISAFVVFPDDPGFSIAERIDVIAPHPLATIRFTRDAHPGRAAAGSARRGLQDRHAHPRHLPLVGGGGRARLRQARARRGAASRAPAADVGATLADLQLTQAKLGDMATMIDAAALLTYRAAWRRDVQGQPTTQEAAMAKMAATEGAQSVIDAAVQMFGGRGVRTGEMVESLYREIRALRIYEGATEVQKLIIARELLKRASSTT